MVKNTKTKMNKKKNLLSRKKYIDAFVKSTKKSKNPYEKVILPPNEIEKALIAEDPETYNRYSFPTNIVLPKVWQMESLKKHLLKASKLKKTTKTTKTDKTKTDKTKTKKTTRNFKKK